MDIPTPSRFIDKSYTVVIKNILIYDNLKNANDYVVFENDIRKELERYGDIEEILVPRPPYMRQGYGKYRHKNEESKSSNRRL